MKPLLLSLTLVGALLASAEPARAIIQTSVVVGLGIALPEAPLDPEALARRLDAVGLVLLATPSVVTGDQPTPTAWFAVRRLGTLAVDRDGDPTTSVPPPTAADIEVITKLLGGVGLRGDVKLWLITQRSGGR